MFNSGVICYGPGGGGQLPHPDPSLPPLPAEILFSTKNLVITKICLYNSSIKRNRSVFFSISLPLWYFMAHFYFLTVIFTGFGKIGSNFIPRPPLGFLQNYNTDD